MKQDISRESFAPQKNFVAVRSQQGRIITDADWNEQAAIQNHLRVSLARDSVSPTPGGAAAAPAHRPGFAIAPQLNPAGEADLEISAGSAYINGRLVENFGAAFFSEQRDLPGATLPDTDGVYLAYLDVWERGVGFREHPEIREIALGDVPDSSARTQLVRQVRLLSITGGDNADAATIPPEWSQLISRSPGRLAARTMADGVSTDPCSIGARGGYTGTNNQLYRVEVHAPGPAGTATFKWSRDNGSIATEWLDQDGERLSYRSRGRDQATAFAPGQWIELDDEGRELDGRPGTFARIAQVSANDLIIDPDSLIHGDSTSIALDINDFAHGVRRIRRWDMIAAGGPATVPADGAFIVLENGIEISFDADPAREYRTGEAWLIPARAINRNITWPCDPASPGQATPLYVPPQSHQHEYGRLAFLKREAGVWTALADARRIFAALAEANLYYAGGDGQAVIPDTELAQALRVSVRSGPYAIAAARVRFSILSGGGLLRAANDPANAGAIITVPADAEGFAAVRWQCGAANLSAAQVQAVLLDESAQPLPAAALDFQAHRSDARTTDYNPQAVPDPQGSDLMQDVTTSQAALDRLGEIKVNRAGDVIEGDFEIQGTLTVRGDVVARDTDHMPGDVLLGDQDEDTVTIHGVLKSEHTSGALHISDAVEIRSPDIADHPLQVYAQIQGVAGRAFRRAITLDHTGGAEALADYQVQLTLDTAALIAAGNLRPDAGDLLFVDADETTVLPYWLESGLNTSTTKLWVRVPAIAAGATHTIYVYYGNADAVSQSSPAQTFVRVIDDVTAAFAMDAGSGTNIADSSGNGLSGAINGATWTTGRFNNALQFDGVNDYVSLGTNPLLFPAASVSLSAWMKFSGLYGFLFSNWWGADWRGLNVGVWGDGENGPNATDFGIFAGGDTADDQLEGPSKYNDDQWHHVVAVYDQANLQLRLYIDGALIASKTTTVDAIQYGANIATEARIGASAHTSGTHYHFAGIIDELKLYGRALSDQDAAVLFQNYGYVTNALPGRELVRRLAASDPLASVGGEEALSASEQTALFVQSQTGNVGIGTTTPGERLSVAGLIESTVGGIKFPDGTIQTTAGGPGGGGDSLPLGTIMAWHRDLSGTPPLPAGWVECNGQIVGDPASPYNGQTLPDLNNPKESWNSQGSFLRGGTTSGEFEDDQFQGHWHQVIKDQRVFEWYENTPNGIHTLINSIHHTPRHGTTNSWYTAVDAMTDGANGAPRTGTETRPVNMTVVWIIKILDTAGTGGTGGGQWSRSGDTIFYNTGNVGVGTSSPNEALTVNGALSLKEQPQLADGTANHGKLYVRQGGPVSISFDGIDDYVDLSAHIPAFQSLTTGTISLWFRSRTGNSPGQSLLRFGALAQIYDGLEIWNGPISSGINDETLTLFVSRNGTTELGARVRLGEQYLNDREWHHIAVVVGAGFNRIYLDGIDQPLSYDAGNANTGGTFLATGLAPDRFMLGRRTATGFGEGYLNGFLDEIAIFDRPLAESEIVSIHEANRTADLAQDFEGVFSPNLAGYWRATNFDANTLNDSSGNDRDGIMQGAQVTPDYPAALVYKDPQGVESILNGGAGLPLGTIIAWHKDLTGTPNLPDGWVECNGQILNDPFSAYNGQTMPDLNNPKESWNTKGSFLRGDTTSGVFEDDEFQGHRHAQAGQLTTNPGDRTHAMPGGSAWGHSTDMIRDPSPGTNGTPRFGSETRPTNMSVVWIIKVKEATPPSAPGPLQYAFLYDRKASGTHGGTATPNLWLRRDLNAIDTNIPGAGLNANQFSLPEGTYSVEAFSSAFEIGYYRTKIVNITNGQDVLYSENGYNAAPSNSSTGSRISGVFTIADQAIFELQIRTTQSTGPGNLGLATNLGIDEIYTTVKLQRIDAPVPAVADPAPAPDIGFSASGGAHVSSGSPSPLVYSTIYTNEGDAFDGTNFTATYAGLYSFTVTFVKDTFNQGGTDDDVWVSILQNGTGKGRATAGQGAGARDSASYSVLLKLEVGDIVHTVVSSDEGGLQRHLPEHHFQGYRV